MLPANKITPDNRWQFAKYKTVRTYLYSKNLEKLYNTENAPVPIMRPHEMVSSLVQMAEISAGRQMAMYLYIETNEFAYQLRFFEKISLFNFPKCIRLLVAYLSKHVTTVM